MTAEAMDRPRLIARAGVRRTIRPGRIVVWTLLFMGGITMVIPFIFMIST